MRTPLCIAPLLLLVLLRCDFLLAKTAYYTKSASTASDEANSAGVAARFAGDWVAAVDEFASALELSASEAGALLDSEISHRDRFHANVNLLSALLAVIYPRNLAASLLALSSRHNAAFVAGPASPWPRGRLQPVVASLHAVASRAYSVWSADWDGERILIESSWASLALCELLPLWSHLCARSEEAARASRSAADRGAVRSHCAGLLAAPLVAAPCAAGATLHPTDAVQFARLVTGMLEVSYVAGIDRHLCTVVAAAAEAVEALSQLRSESGESREAGSRRTSGQTSSAALLEEGPVASPLPMQSYVCNETVIVDAGRVRAAASLGFSALRAALAGAAHEAAEQSGRHASTDGAFIFSAAARGARRRSDWSPPHSSAAPGAIAATRTPARIRIAFVGSDFRRHSVGYALHGIV